MITPSDAAARRRRGQDLARTRTDGRGLAISVFGSFNLDLLPPYLVEACDRAGLSASVDVRPFTQAAQELLDPESELVRAGPDVLVFVVSAEDAVGAENGLIEQLQQLIAALLERLPGATILLVPMGPNRAQAEHVLSPLAPERGRARMDRFLTGVYELASATVLVGDWEWRVRRAGSDVVEDRRLWYLARMRLGPVGLAHLAETVAETLAAARGGARKVCAVDLDGVLWGESVGEVGLGGIVLGDEGVGLAYQDFQRVLLGLRETGVLLAICSKNDPQVVEQVFGNHPAMVLHREHFSAERINWDDKAKSLGELAAELGVGIDSFVFLDDDPVQRAWVRDALPEVVVPELPPDASDRPDFLRRAPFFQRIAMTVGDAGRADDYRSRTERRALERVMPSLEEFIAGLEQHVRIEPVREASFGRALQLLQRTNQFNLTARRYSATELERLITDASVEIVTLAVSDRFGDSGLTGLVVLRFAGSDAEVDTLLVSCRVLGRRVEDALLAFIAARARERGAHRLIGLFLPSGKNDLTRDFYADRGFARDGDGRFVLDLEEGRLAAPSGITVEVATLA